MKRTLMTLVTLALVLVVTVQLTEALGHKQHHHKVHRDNLVVQLARDHKIKFNDDGFQCPTESGYFPHPNCLKFWQCGNWIAYEMDCAPGTQWNQTLLTCDHLSTCGVTSPPSPPAADLTTPEPEEPVNDQTSAAPGGPSTEGPDNGASFTCPTESGYFPHEDCWKFWQCGNGIAYEQTCAPGTQWSQELLTCDHITTCQRPAEDPQPTTEAPEEPDNEVTTDSSEAEQPVNDETSTAAPEEPAGGFTCPTESGYFPHADCWKFWQCGNGIAYEQTCAPGTQWSQELLTCDHITTCQRPETPEPTTAAPEEPGNDEPSTAAPEEPENEPSTAAPEEPSTAAPEEPGNNEPSTAAPEQPGNDEASTAAPEEPAGGFTCPSESGYFPHEDCWKFWQCGNGIAYEQTCAPGTQWSQELLTCDHITTCQRPAEEPQPTTEAPEEPDNEVTTDSSEAEQPVNDETSTAAPEEPAGGFTCPTESGYFPHADCWKFWQCGNGIAYEQTCAPGTQWSQELLTCDHITTCQRPPEEPQPTTEAPEEPDNDEPSTAAPDVPTDAPQEPSTTAPEVPDNGEPSTAAPEEPESEPSTAAPEEPDNSEPSTEAPEEGAFTCPSRYGYYPHQDCWKYWQCGNWIAYEMTCPTGTQWSQDLLTCDHLTTCQRPAEPTTEAEEPANEPSTAAPEEPVNSEPTTAAPEEPESEPSTAAPEEPGNDQASTAAPEQPEDDPTTAAPEQPSPTPAPFECPARYGYYPHSDCWKFWQCGNWIAYEMTCAPGTQWDQSLLTCNHLTTCQRPPVQPPQEAPSTTTEAPTEAPTQASTAAPGGEFKCPSRYGYFVHQECWKFWQCGNWIAYEMTCPRGTQWDQSILTCNHLTTCQRPSFKV